MAAFESELPRLVCLHCVASPPEPSLPRYLGHLQSIPRDIPIIASHCFVGMLAVSLGFKHVVNLVIDNHAQWFIVVPGEDPYVPNAAALRGMQKANLEPNRAMLNKSPATTGGTCSSSCPTGPASLQLAAIV